VAQSSESTLELTSELTCPCQTSIYRKRVADSWLLSRFMLARLMHHNSQLPSCEECRVTSKRLSLPVLIIVISLSSIALQ